MSSEQGTSLQASTQLISGYGDGRFQIAGETHAGSVFVLPEKTAPWGITTAEQITPEPLIETFVPEGQVQVLLIGCGPTFVPPPKGLRAALSAAGLTLEWMDTGAACRTFNVLLSENRAVGAALIAVE
ncbi:MAG: Mth938-like domain-containing protein [Magnetospiraceae bacterium]